jgi:hypothetical protein
MKVKIFSSHDYIYLEQEVNEFTKKNYIIDIKFTEVWNAKKEKTEKSVYILYGEM